MIYNSPLEAARQYLLDYPAGSQEFESAAEHLKWTNKNDEENRGYVNVIVKDVVARRKDEAHTMRRLKELMT